MENSIQEFRPYLKNYLEAKKLRYEWEDFPSGCSMIDVWLGERCFVIQYEITSIGFSELTDDEISFTSVPDERYYSLTEFQKIFEQIFG